MLGLVANRSFLFVPVEFRRIEFAQETGNNLMPLTTNSSKAFAPAVGRWLVRATRPCSARLHTRIVQNDEFTATEELKTV